VVVEVGTDVVIADGDERTACAVLDDGVNGMDEADDVGTVMDGVATSGVVCACVVVIGVVSVAGVDVVSEIEERLRSGESGASWGIAGVEVTVTDAVDVGIGGWAAGV